MRKIISGNFPKNTYIQLLLVITINFIFAFPISANSNTSLPLLQEKLNQLSSGNVSFTYHPQAPSTLHNNTQRVSFLTVNGGGSITQPFNGIISSDPGKVAINFLTDYSGLFGENYKAEYSLIKHNKISKRHSVKLRQTYQAIPIFAGEMVVRLNSELAVTGANGEIASNLEDFSTKPVLSTKEAKSAAIVLVSKHYQVETDTIASSKPDLWIYNPSLVGNSADINKLVWKMEVTDSNKTSIRELVMVDALTGEIVWHINQIMHAKDRNIYDNENDINRSLPGNSIVRAEGDPAVNTDVDAAYDYSGDTYDFFNMHHGRDSLDDAGMTMISTVRHCEPGNTCPYVNAFWNGTQMAYGNGFSAADDVVAHELTHAVTQFTSNLVYANQSGAINESFSDVWGEFVDLTNSGGTDTAQVRWHMGEDVPGFGAIRNLSDPGVFNHPDKVTSSNYYCGSGDNGGVHTNSGVNNKAAYLMADGDTFNGITVNGIGIIKTAKIYYEAQTNILTSGSTYQDLYSALQAACTNLVGTDGITTGDCSSVKDALDAVEMNSPVCYVPPIPVCDVGTPNNIYADDFESGISEWTHLADQGSDVWSLSNSNPESGSSHIHGDDVGTTSDSHIKNNSAINLPANAFMRFDHFYDFEASFDGGVLEYTIDDGENWIDAGSLFTDNGYNGTISSSFGNPLASRSAYVSDTMGVYTASRLDLSSLAGSNIKFRYRIGTDSSVSNPGWDIDNVRVYTCDIDSTPKISSPVPSSTLKSSTETFVLNPNGADIQEWWLYAGSSEGAYDYYFGGNDPSNSTLVTGLPTDGSTIYIKIWYQIDGNWDSINTTYTAATILAPEIATPSPSSVLSGAAETFTLNPNGRVIQQWWLYAGSSEGTYDHYFGGNDPSNSTLVTGLPTDGSPVYIKIWYQIDGNWDSINTTYTAATILTPNIAAPSPGSALSGATETFTLNPNGRVIQQWWLYAGSSAGAYDYYFGGNDPSNSILVTGLPTDGSTVYIKTWYQIDGNWDSIDATYSAAID